MTRKLHIFQHVDFEGPALIGEWARKFNHDISTTRFFAGDPFPDMASFDMLIVLGGPMGVHDTRQHLWLEAEIDYLKKVMAEQTPILGVCLGAQLLAKALGASVYSGKHKEIGWLPIELHQKSFPVELQRFLPDDPVVFHWHGDTFDLPANSVALASSAATPNQAFLHGDRVIGLQFHLETTKEAIISLVDNCSDEIDNSPYVKTATQMLADIQHIEGNRILLDGILEYLNNRI
ncbi:MAG: type 1 glutamine amidotransferase [Desulfocapsaceae bacterium]|nr:type 1 glutamine amidotransferase [Desulfocapsaceae bacterium]